MPKIIVIPKNKLQKLYLDTKLSSYEIAKVFQCSQALIIKKLSQYGIKTRTIQEGKALMKPRYKRRDFNGNLREKAYLIGFRLGDLYVSKTHPDSPTIRVSTNTTRQEQVFLMRKLFQRYGYLKQYNRDKNGATSVRAFLNNSFSFLLKKEDLIVSWIIKSKSFFLSFLGGYIDAEGSFISKQNKVFSIQTQDKKILKQISINLRKYGVKCMEPIISRKENSYMSGIRSNRDVWMIYIYNRENLLNFIKLVKSFIHHPKRKADMLILLKKLNHVWT